MTYTTEQVKKMLEAAYFQGYMSYIPSTHDAIGEDVEQVDPTWVKWRDEYVAAELATPPESV